MHEGCWVAAVYSDCGGVCTTLCAFQNSQNCMFKRVIFTVCHKQHILKPRVADFQNHGASGSLMPSGEEEGAGESWWGPSFHLHQAGNQRRDDRSPPLSRTISPVSPPSPAAELIGDNIRTGGGRPGPWSLRVQPPLSPLISRAGVGAWEFTVLCAVHFLHV